MTMPEDQITFRTNPRIKAAIAELVRQKSYRNTSDFVNHAILLTFQLERIQIEGQPVGPDPVADFFDSLKGREILREVILAARES